MGEGGIYLKLKSHGLCSKCRGECILCCVLNVSLDVGQVGFGVFVVQILLYFAIKNKCLALWLCEE